MVDIPCHIWQAARLAVAMAAALEREDGRRPRPAAGVRSGSGAAAQAPVLRLSAQALRQGLLLKHRRHKGCALRHPPFRVSLVLTQLGAVEARQTNPKHRLPNTAHSTNVITANVVSGSVQKDRGGGQELVSTTFPVCV